MDTNKININITGRRLTIRNRETLFNIAVISLLSLSTNIIFMFNILPLYPFKYIILAIDTIIFSIVDPKLKIAKKGDRAPSTCDIDKVYILTCSQLSLVSTMLATGFLMSKTEYTIMVNSIFFVVLLLSLFALSVAVNNKTDILHNIATSICGSSQKKDT